MDTAQAAVADRLRVSEIFYSLQGETRTVGWPTVFVRLTGCPLRCGYCDTEYAFRGGRWMAVSAILSEVAAFGARYVTVTGGEPLAQKNCLKLLSRLCDLEYQVSLETSGAMDIRDVDPRVVKVVDLKTPGSGEVDKNLYRNIHYLEPKDQVKFVICDRSDYEWAKAALDRYRLDGRCEVLFSPSHGQLDAGLLADWMLADRLPVRLQIQLHKYLWGDVPGR
ncbi:MAG: 7-carboxy-7-deazaguanine synthase QueE [Gammaproteobacteria bacterium]